MSERQELLQKALIAESCGRHRQMANLMREIAEMNISLSDEEKQTLSVAYYKALADPIAISQKIYGKLRELKDNDSNVQNEIAASLHTLHSRLLAEIRNICAEVSQLLACHLLPSAILPENEVFYMKWQADILRCATVSAEPGSSDGKRFLELCTSAYSRALDLSAVSLSPANRVRLALTLNYCTFTAEVLGDPEQASDLAIQAIEDAAAEWVASDRNSLPTVSAIIHLLHKNAIAWRGTALVDSPRDSSETEESSSSHDDIIFSNPKPAVDRKLLI